MGTIDPTLLDGSQAAVAKIPTFSHFSEYARRLLHNHDWETGDLGRLCDALYTLQDVSKRFAWIRRPEHQIMWNDVDNLVGRLLNSGSRSWGSLWTSPPRFDRQFVSCSPTASKQPGPDDSDFDDDEADAVFAEIDEILAEFTEPYSRKFLVTRPMTARSRRQVHCMAQCRRLGHMTIGRGSLCSMLLSNSPAHFPRWLKRDYKMARACQSSDFDFGTFTNPRHGQMTEYDHENVPYSHSEHFDEHNGSGYSSASSLGSLYSHFNDGLNFGCHPDTVGASYSGRRKRKRQASGFPCLEPDCSELFDRQCDLTQHERSHLPYHQRPYPCEHCDKRFLFPKDLRRHERIHQPASEADVEQTNDNTATTQAHMPTSLPSFILSPDSFDFTSNDGFL